MYTVYLLAPAAAAGAGPSNSHDDDVLDHQTGSKEENIECHFVSVSICSPAAPGSDCS